MVVEGHVVAPVSAKNITAFGMNAQNNRCNAHDYGIILGLALSKLLQLVAMRNRGRSMEYKRLGSGSKLMAGAGSASVTWIGN